MAATATQTPTRWLVPCSHTFFPSATENELEALRAGLRQDIPFPLVELLQITNGAELFRIHYLTSKNGYWIPRYEVLSCARLLKVNRELLEIFESYAEFDENYHEELESLKLDYLAFCDVGDGNHLALHLTPSPVQPVFYLDHDYGAYPYSDRSAREGYPLIANSLPEWLELLIRTDGRDGLGGVFIPL
ncbi:MAG: SMI1/KNR4 family protein [Candidatus Promineifilaceae bacterium]